jgi:hypothetical protein
MSSTNHTNLTNGADRGVLVVFVILVVLVLKDGFAVARVPYPTRSRNSWLRRSQAAA